MASEDPLIIRFQDTLRLTAESEIRASGALADRDTAIRELQYIHHRIMVEVDKVTAAQQLRHEGDLHTWIETVERIVSSENL